MTPENAPDHAQDHQVSASAGGMIATLGMAILMLAGFVLNLDRLLIDGVELRASKNNLSAILDGTASTDLAADLADTALPVEAAKMQRAASWLLLADLGPKVRKGCPEWLFLTDELTPHSNGSAARLERANQVKSVEQFLAERQIRLVVAVVPDKSRVMDQHMCSLQRPEAMATRAQEWVARLRADGIHALDLTQALSASKTPAFLRTDTHWSPAGAEQAARAVAQAVHAVYAEPLTPQQQFETIAQGAPARPGDLVRLAGIDWLPARLQPALENVPKLAFKSPLPASSNDVPPSEDDLFGDTRLPTVALIGTSFSRTSHFGDFLSQALGTPIANLAKDGGGFTGSAQDYFQSSTFKETPPRVLVWEIPERDLELPLSNTRPLPVQDTSK